MASVTISSLTDGQVQVSTVASGAQRRFITALGPLKVEWNYFQVDSDADVFTDNDTFKTKLVTPMGAAVLPMNSDLGGTAFAGSVSLDTDPTSATFRTVTLRDITANTVDAILVVVIGF